MGLTVAIRGADLVERNLDRLGKDTRRQIQRTTRRQALLAQRQLRSHLSGRTLKPRTGLLRSSIGVKRVAGLRGRVAFEVGTNVRYAASHEEGVTIRPSFRGGRFIVTGRRADGSLTGKISRGTKLAIPIGQARTRRGVAKSDRIDQTALKLSRGLPFSTFVRDGVLLLARRTPGGRSRVMAIAALKDKVKLRGRHFFQRTAEDRGRAWLAQIRFIIRRAIQQNGGA